MRLPGGWRLELEVATETGGNLPNETLGGSFLTKRSVNFWYLQISRRAEVPDGNGAASVALGIDD
jgi:hypothetical protein